MSKEILKSELDIFKKPQFQGSIENSQFVQFRPINAINDASTIEFFIPGSSDEYIDLENIFFWISGNLLKHDGTAFDASQNDRNSLVNYGLNTIFEQLDVYLNNTLISQSSNTYGYKSFIEILFMYDNKSHHTFLRSSGYMTFGQQLPDQVDTGLGKIFNQSKTFKFYGRPHSDIFNCNRLLINGVDIRLNFIKAKDAFCCMGSKGHSTLADTTPKLVLTDANLFVRKVKIAPGVLIAQAKALQASKAIYPIKRSEVKMYNLQANQSTFPIDNIYLGQMPYFMIIGFVDHKSASGDYYLNPFSFKNFNLNFLNVHINSEIFPMKAYQPSYSTENYEREFYEFHHQMGFTNGIGISDITYKLFKDYVNLYCFNFNADFSNDAESYINIPKEGNLGVDVKFSSSLSEAVKMVCYSRFNNNIEIDFNRNVTIDY